MPENGFSSHGAWRQAWRESRNNQFFLVGSKNETAGNQNCQAKPDPTDPTGRRFHLTLTLPVGVTGTEKPTRITVPVAFSKKAATPIRQALSTGQALTWRWVRVPRTTRTGQRLAGPGGITSPDSPSHDWAVHVTIDLQESLRQSLTSAGAIGLDFNADHIAACRVDANGNPVDVKRIPLNPSGKTAGQCKQIIGDAVKAIVDWATQEKLPLVVERLDFVRKKKTLGQDRSPQGKRYARLLSGLAYATFFQTLESRDFDAGLVVHRVNPAYTCVIGRAVWAQKYGLSTHLPAAVCISPNHRHANRMPPVPGVDPFGIDASPSRCTGAR